MAKNKFHDGPGPSQRQLRVGELIRRTLADVLARGDIHDPDLNRLSVTVGEVRTSPDLKVATAYVLPLGGHGKSDVLELLGVERGVVVLNKADLVEEEWLDLVEEEVREFTRGTFLAGADIFLR